MTLPAVPEEEWQIFRQRGFDLIWPRGYGNTTQLLGSKHCLIQLADPDAVRAYVKDLKQLLETSELVEQKAFSKSFVERIEVGECEAKVIYAIPMPPANVAMETVGVLPFIQDGSAYRIRTGGLLLEREVS